MLFFGILAFYEVGSYLIYLFVRLKKGPEGEIKMLIGVLRVLTFLTMILSIIYILGILTAFSAVVAGFIGLLLGWSLQAPVSGFAAWFLIALKRPFRIGDRIRISGLIGDITDIGLMYTTLNQVGGAVGTEEAVNRNVLIPNAMLFSNIIINDTVCQEAAYILDEVIARITYDSDWDLAETILLNAAREVTKDIIQATKQEPYIRSDIYDYGIYLRLRYMAPATDRPRIIHEITKQIFMEFQINPKVDFAIPYVYSFKKRGNWHLSYPVKEYEQSKKD